MTAVAAPPRPAPPAPPPAKTAPAERSAAKEIATQAPAAPQPWRLDLLADDGTTAQVLVPDAGDRDGWDRAEALVTSALTGVIHRPAGRTLRATRSLGAR